MEKQSIIYKYPVLYKQSLKLIHGKNLIRRYRFIAGFIKRGERVLEPACGIALLVDFLPKGSFYFGFDLNEGFIKYARKKHKNSKIYLGDILNSKNYFPVDVVVICDVLHHLTMSKREVFLRHCFESAKKRVIICEPKGKKHLFLEGNFFEYFDQDGINVVKTENLWTEGFLRNQIKRGFGIIPSSVPRQIKEIGKDIICIFSKEKGEPLKIRKRKTVSVIVPIFNEEKTVEKVIRAFLDSDFVDEIICVNDGSTDRSLEILEHFGNKIKLINLRKNKGKGYALAAGVKKAKGEIVVFFDADFVNLSPEYIWTLIEPVLKNDYKAALGIPIEYDLDVRSSVHNVLTGQRVYYKKTVLPHIENIKKTKFGVEIFLNKLVKRKETKVVPLRGLIYLNKFKKRKASKAIKEYLVMTLGITKELAKRKGILSKDIQIIERLKEPINLKELKNTISQLKNKEIKKILENYIIKYLDR